MSLFLSMKFWGTSKQRLIKGIPHTNAKIRETLALRRTLEQGQAGKPENGQVVSSPAERGRGRGAACAHWLWPREGHGDWGDCNFGFLAEGRSQAAEG